MKELGEREEKDEKPILRVHFVSHCCKQWGLNSVLVANGIPIKIVFSMREG